jgi:hypothetical protein
MAGILKCAFVLNALLAFVCFQALTQGERDASRTDSGNRLWNQPAPADSRPRAWTAVDGGVTVNYAVAFDVSPPFASLRSRGFEAAQAALHQESQGRTAFSPVVDVRADEAQGQGRGSNEAPAAPPVTAAGAAVEQKSQGSRPPARLLASFDGLGVGFVGPQGTSTGRNPSDNSLAVGPNRIVQIVNSRMAVFTKKGELYETTGKVLYGAAPTNTIFKGFGGRCEQVNNGDSVVRYDQLAGRWLYVMPIFSRPPGEPQGAYSMCYAVSAGPDPLGPYYRYEFKRPLFPDYPRPAIWPDGYYIPTSTGDNVIQKHACVADRNKMLQGLPATEQCVIIDGVNFLNNADIDGEDLPPAGAPNIMMATGGAQLKNVFDDDGIYVWKFHVDWDTPANTKVTGPEKIMVAPYHYLCSGQLTNCVPQPGTDRRLDAQGDKIMQRLVYWNQGDHESILALHSVNTSAGGGGVRWYEFRFNDKRDPYLYQQGTYAPDAFYRWMGSIGMDRQGDIGIGYSFGGTPNFAGQRFAARLAGDPLGLLTFQETVLVDGEAAQTNTVRWEDFATTVMDPADDCTFWYVGDYLKKDATSYSSRIGAFRLPGCLRANVSGKTFFDLNHNGRRDPDEPALAGRRIEYSGGQSGELTTDANGKFSASLPADPAYLDPTYTISEHASANPALIESNKPYTVHLMDQKDAGGIDFGSFCVVQHSGGRDLRFWSSGAGLLFWSRNNGKAMLNNLDPAWWTLINVSLYLVNADGSRFTTSAASSHSNDQFRTWLRTAASANMSHIASTQLAAVALNVISGSQDGTATVQDPVAGDWPAINALIRRVSAFLEANPDASVQSSSRSVAEKYKNLLESLNNNTAKITPSNPARCGPLH